MSTVATHETLTARLTRIFDNLSRRLSFLAPALLRVTVGVPFVITGWGKLHGLDDVTAFFTTLGIPVPGLNAAVVASTEFFGGMLILVGLGTRVAALPLAFTMAIAILTARRAEVDGFNTLLGFDEWQYLVMFLVLALIGPGALSVDALLARHLGRRGRGVPTLPGPALRPAA
jgi:putative oxidoreductase